MNGGALSTNAEPPTTAAYSATNGGWNSTTGVFTPTSGDPSATVTVGDFASVFNDGATTPVFVGRVTAVNSTTVTVSTTAKGGTAPTTNATARSINVGGAWLGPNGAVQFPVNFAAGVMVNAAGDSCRVNFKNNQTYGITAAMNHTIAGPVHFQGYTTTFGDLGKATIDGGVAGASYILLANSGTPMYVLDLIFQNNGATGLAAGVSVSNSRLVRLTRVVVHDVRGGGIVNGHLLECEAYACNQSNTANLAGMDPVLARRCISHNNVGSNSIGFVTSSGARVLIDCISDSNGLHGFFSNSVTDYTLIGCDAYGNGGDGWQHVVAAGHYEIENCNFVGNAGWGVNITTTARGILWNCGFGDNVSGAKTNTGGLDEVGTVTYGAGVTPWVDPANGDFRIDLTASKNTGRGSFTQTAPSYSGTIGYPDIGAAQHLDSGGGGTGISRARAFSGFA